MIHRGSQISKPLSLSMKSLRNMDCAGYKNDLHRLQYIIATSRLGFLQKSRQNS